MKKLNHITIILLAASLSACMTDPVDTSYGSTVSGYTRGESTFASTDLTESAIIPQRAAPVNYSTLANGNGAVITQGAVMAPQPMMYQAIPANAYPAAAGAITTSANGIPVIINSQATASPYSSLSSADRSPIQQNVFGTVQPQQAYVPGQPYYGLR